MTRAALEAFQSEHGLDVDGICGPITWTSLVDAGYTLGDRLLYLSSPMLRGDDVAELQRRLGVLGFDTGRVDGVLGPDTDHALKEFQRNSGLPSDGICGQDTIATFARLTPRAGTGASNVTVVREMERLRTGNVGLQHRSVVITEPGGLDSLAAAMRRSFIDAGAAVLTVHHPDRSAQAAQANRFDADVVVALEARPGPTTVSYFSAPGIESTAGAALAACIGQSYRELLGECVLQGLRLPLLRETKMPAVVVRFGDLPAALRLSAAVAKHTTSATAHWIAQIHD